MTWSMRRRAGAWARRARRHAAAVVATAVAALFLAACAAAPEAVHWGVEECAQCQMVISDDRYAAQVVDQRGKTYKFDAIECMTAFLNGDRLAAGDIHSVWVADGRDAWVRAEDAHFVHSENIRSPMGGGLTAHGTADAARQLHTEVGGEILPWAAVLQLSPVPHAHGTHEGH
jgi:copper chaperone NosL